MSNGYFNHIANVIAAGTRALAAQVNNIASEIAAGFDKFPTEIELKENRTVYGVDTGAADAYVVTLTYVPTLTDGLNFFFKATNANTGASTLDVNGLGAKSLLLISGAELVVADIVADQQIWVIYEADSDSFYVLSQSSSAGGGGGNALTSTLVDESSDTTAFVVFVNDATGSLIPLKTGTNLTFNSSTGLLTATALTIAGDITGAATAYIKTLWSSYARSNNNTGMIIKDDTTLASFRVILPATSGTSNPKAVYPDVFLAGGGDLNDTGSMLVGMRGIIAGLPSIRMTGVAQTMEITAGGGVTVDANVTVTQSGTGTGLAVNLVANAIGLAAYDNTSVAVSNALSYIQADNANRTGWVSYVNQKHASSTAIAQEVVQAGSGTALRVSANGSGPAIEIAGNGQIKFPATAVPSSDANTLDDYEEGTWTPTIQDGSASDGEGQTYSTNTGSYTKIGNLVFVCGEINLTSYGTLTTSHGARIAGLPFTAKNQSSSRGGLQITYAANTGVHIDGDRPAAEVQPNDTYAWMSKWNGNASSPAQIYTIADLGTGGQIYFNGTYIVE